MAVKTTLSYHFGFWIADFGLQTVGRVSVLDVDRSQSFFKLGITQSAVELSSVSKLNCIPSQNLSR
jgi:hypothetical protein